MVIAADIPGAVQRGLQFRQAAQLRPGALQSQQFGLQRQEQQLQTGALQQQNIQGQIDQRTDQQKNRSLLDAALRVENLSDEQLLPFFEQNIIDVQSKGGVADTSIQARDLLKQGKIEEVRQSAKSVIDIGVRQGDILAEPVTKLSPLQQKVAAEGIDPSSEAGFARAKELNQRAATDPSLKPSDQQILAKANEGQLAAAGFANRVQSANKNIDDIILDPNFDQTSIQAAFFGSIPLGNIALSEQQQRFAQAKSDFITAVLRKESGAAIGVDEFAKEDKKFFPQIGDKPGVLKQKALGRKRAFENLSKQSKGVFDVQFKNPQIFENGGDLSQAELTELADLERRFGGQ
jgi:hypothetical protein